MRSRPPAERLSAPPPYRAFRYPVTTSHRADGASLHRPGALHRSSGRRTAPVGVEAYAEEALADCRADLLSPPLADGSTNFTTGGLRNRTTPTPPAQRDSPPRPSRSPAGRTWSGPQSAAPAPPRYHPNPGPALLTRITPLPSRVRTPSRQILALAPRLPVVAGPEVVLEQSEPIERVGLPFVQPTSRRSGNGRDPTSCDCPATSMPSGHLSKR